MNAINRLGTGVKIGAGFGLAALLILTAFSQFHRLLPAQRSAIGHPSPASARTQPDLRTLSRLQTLAGQLEKREDGAPGRTRDLRQLTQAAERLEKRLGSIDLDRVRTLVSALRLVQYTYLFDSQRRYRDHFHRLLASLKKSLDGPSLDNRLRDRLRRAILTYEAAFSGFLASDVTLTSGGPPLERLNASGIALTNIIETHHVPHAGEELLNARRHAAFYFLQGDDRAAKAFETALDRLAEFVKYTRLPDSERKRVQADIDTYRLTFRRLAVQQPAVAMDNSETVRSLRALISDLESDAHPANGADPPPRSDGSGGAGIEKTTLALFILAVLLPGALIAWLVTQLVSAPWRRLVNDLDDLDSGYTIDLSRRIVAGENRETGAVVEGINRILDAVAEAVQQARDGADALSDDSEPPDTKELIHGLRQAGQALEETLEHLQTLTGQANMLAINAAIQATGAGEAEPAYAVVADDAETLLRQLETVADTFAGHTKSLQSMAERAQNQETAIASRLREVARAGAELQRSLQRLQT